MFLLVQEWDRDYDDKARALDAYDMLSDTNMGKLRSNNISAELKT